MLANRIYLHSAFSRRFGVHWGLACKHRRIGSADRLVIVCAMVMCGALLFATLPFVSVFVRADEQGDEAKRERQLLADAGFKPTAEGSILFLDRLRPNDQTRKKVAQLIARLGHSSFFTRQRATLSLESLGLHAEAQLLRASKGDDLEVAFQTQRLLKTIRSGRDPELHDARIVAALGILSRQQHRDTVTTIVDTIPVLSNTKQLKQAWVAVWFAARSTSQFCLLHVILRCCGFPMISRSLGSCLVLF